MNFQCTIIGLLGLVPVLLTSLDAFWSIEALMPPQAPTAQLLQLLQLHLNYARTHLTSSDPQFFCVGKGQVVCYGLLVCHFTALVSSSSLMKREAMGGRMMQHQHHNILYHHISQQQVGQGGNPKVFDFLENFEKTIKADCIGGNMG